MVRPDFEIPQSFLVKNSKNHINFNNVTNVSFWEPSSNFGTSNNLRKIVGSTCGWKNVAIRICEK